MPLALVSMCIIASVLILTGVYEKLEKIGNMGFVMPLTGVVSGMAGLYQLGAGEGDESKGLRLLLKLAAFVFVGAGICSAVVGIVYAFIG